MTVVYMSPEYRDKSVLVVPKTKQTKNKNRFWDYKEDYIFECGI